MAGESKGAPEGQGSQYEFHNKVEFRENRPGLTDYKLRFDDGTLIEGGDTGHGNFTMNFFGADGTIPHTGLVIPDDLWNSMKHALEVIDKTQSATMVKGKDMPQIIGVVVDTLLLGRGVMARK